MTTDRFVRNNQVAVLYSPGYGAGWSTWAAAEFMPGIIFDPWIADILLSDNFDQAEKIIRITAHCAVKYPDLYLGGLETLTVRWIPQGQQFRITEYDGYEKIEVRDQLDWVTA